MIESLDPSLLYGIGAAAAGVVVGWLGSKKWYNAAVDKADELANVLTEAGEFVTAAIPVLKGNPTAETMQALAKEGEDLLAAIQKLVV